MANRRRHIQRGYVISGAIVYGTFTLLSKLPTRSPNIYPTCNIQGTIIRKNNSNFNDRNGCKRRQSERQKYTHYCYKNDNQLFVTKVTNRRELVFLVHVNLAHGVQQKIQILEHRHNLLLSRSLGA